MTPASTSQQSTLKIPDQLQLNTCLNNVNYDAVQTVNLTQITQTSAVATCITYKLCVLMFDVVHGTVRVYCSERCTRCCQLRPRSSTRGNSVT